MLVTIGRTPLARDAVALLLECHERIRQFVRVAQLLTQHSLAAAEIAAGAAAVHRYFTEAMPLHVEDEERSLLPRLAGRERELDEALERMRREHHSHQGPLQLLVEHCEVLARHPDSLAQLRAPLASNVELLQHELESHLELEERAIFPAVQRLFTPADHAAVMSELRARRHL